MPKRTLSNKLAQGKATEADERLCDAAADLLAACKAMLADVNQAERVGDDCCVGSKASDAARTAIAKATGKPA